MNWKKSFLDEKELLVAGLCIAIAIVFLFVPMKGSDNFYLLGAVCQKDPGITSHFGFLTGFFLQHFSCSETAYKAIGGLLLFWSTIVLMKIGKLFTPRGWMVGLLVFLAPSWVMSFFLWEDNQIGLLFGLVFVYFFLRYQETKKAITLLIALFFLGMGIGFWNGTALFLPAFAIFSPLLIGLTGLLGILAWQNIGALLPMFGVDEAAFGIGWIAWPAFLIVGYHSIPKRLFFPIVFFSIIGFLRAQNAFFVVPFLAVCFAVLFERVVFKKEIVKNKVFGFSFQINPFFEPLFRFKNVFLLVLIMIIGSMGAYALGFGMPNDSTWKAISFSMQKNVSIQNDWWLGHWIYYRGGVPSSEFGPPTVPFVCDERMVLTKEELKEPFFLEKIFGDLRVYSCKASGS